MSIYIRKARSRVAAYRAATDDEAYHEYLDVYSDMLDRNPGKSPFMEAVDDPMAKTGRRDWTTYAIDLWQGTPSFRGADQSRMKHSTGPGKVYGNYVPNERVGVYFPITYEQWQEMEEISPGYHEAIVHDTDLYKGTMSDADYYGNGGHMHYADYRFMQDHPDTVIGMGPYIGHGFVVSNPPIWYEDLKDGGPLKISDLQTSNDVSMDQSSFYNNMTQDHNFEFGAGVPMKEFADTRKLATVDCSLGRSELLHSPIESFFNRFKAKRSLGTSWHHAGSSDLNKRESFTYVFRHCVVSPDEAVVLSPKSGVVNKALADGTNVQLTSAEKDITNSKGKTWFSPYCLKELETLSWNMNNFKLRPNIAFMYNKADEAILPGRVIKDDNRGNEDDALGAATSIFSQTGTHKDEDGFSTWSNHPYSARKEYGYTRLTQASTTTDPAYYKYSNLDYGQLQDSVVKRIAEETSKGNSFRNADEGVNMVQFGRGHLHFTFVNTGDTTMIIDVVVHKGKEKRACFPLSEGVLFPSSHPYTTHAGVSSPADEYWVLPNDDPTTKFVTPGGNGVGVHEALTLPYRINYGNYHQDNQDRKVSDYVRNADDVVVNPEVKFLPTSYRQGTLPKILSAGEESLVQLDGTVQEGFTGGISTYRYQTLAGAAGSDEASNVKGSYQIMTAENVNFVDIQRRKMIVPPNSRKTIHLMMPQVAYDPSQSLYSGCMNDQSFAVTFGVTGKTTKVVVPSNHHEGTAKGAQFVGRTAARTSFHIFGHESQTVYPLFLKEKLDLVSQINRMADPQIKDGNNAHLKEAAYVGAEGRTVDGRYALLHTDGGSTKKHKTDADHHHAVNSTGFSASQAADVTMDIGELETDIARLADAGGVIDQIQIQQAAQGLQLGQLVAAGSSTGSSLITADNITLILSSTCAISPLNTHPNAAAFAMNMLVTGDKAYDSPTGTVITESNLKQTIAARLNANLTYVDVDVYAGTSWAAVIRLVPVTNFTVG